MNGIVIFGKEYAPNGQRKSADAIQKKLDRIANKSNGGERARLHKEFLAELLHKELVIIYAQILKESKIDVFGNLDFEVAASIDKRLKRVAKLKENRIIVKLNAVALPERALKYIVAHEMAHLITKKHGKKFWKVVESIYPAFGEGERLFIDNEEVLRIPLNRAIG